jgi:hypothetical protein
MYPGPGANHLPELTQMEEMLISPVHALIQLWQIRGGQYKYTGHTCNFPRDNIVFHSTVPYCQRNVTSSLCAGLETTLEVMRQYIRTFEFDVGPYSHGCSIWRFIIQPFDLIRSQWIISG